jgi:hypothetical protein
MISLTAYWAWYKERFRRAFDSEQLPSEFLVRSYDRRREEFCEGAHVMIVPSWCKCVIPDHMTGHLPHRVKLRYQRKDDHSLLARWNGNCQEIWCASNIGLRDRDWLYLGNHSWAFRTKEQATQFQMVWI